MEIEYKKLDKDITEIQIKQTTKNSHLFDVTYSKNNKAQKYILHSNLDYKQASKLAQYYYKELTK